MEPDSTIDKRIGLLLAAIAFAGGGGLGTVLSGGGVSLDRYTGLETKVEKIDTRVEKLEAAERSTAIAVMEMQTVLKNIEAKIDRIDKNLGKVP